MKISQLMTRNNLAVSSSYNYTNIKVGFMKSKKGLVSFIFLILFAAVLFVIGWTQLYVPVGKYGVLVSKTNGVDPQVIKAGEITWKWQRLLPTNTLIHVFEARNVKNTVIAEGTLPSSDIYSSLVEGRPDFSYSFTFEVDVSIKPEALPSLVKDSDVQTDEELTAYLEKASNDVAEKAVKLILDELAATKDVYLSSLSDDPELLEYVRSETTFTGVDVNGIKLVTSKLPDVILYNTAKEIYEAYLEGVKNALLETTGSQIELASDDFLLIERFGKLGKVLTDYPILIDYLAVTRDDPDGALSLLDSLKSKN